MAYIKIKPIKTGTHLSTTINYIFNPEKTNNGIYISTFNCSKFSVCKDFEMVSENAIKKGNNIAHHICQSFSTEDNITPELSMQMGRQLMEKMYPDYQYVIATHTDRNHIHNHIIVNAVDFVNYKKLHSNINSLNQMREISDDLCRENGLTVIDGYFKRQRNELKKNIDNAVQVSSSRNELVRTMEDKKYTEKGETRLAFQPFGDDYYYKVDTLGTAYSNFNIGKRLKENASAPNKAINIYDSKPLIMSKRKRLIRNIDNTINTAESFEDFINKMRENGYKIKQGKHLAFLPDDGKKYIRTYTLGLLYTEDMLRLKINNRVEYDEIENEFKEHHIDRIIKPDKEFNPKWLERKNIDIMIDTLNAMDKQNVKSIDDINAAITDIKSKINDKDSLNDTTSLQVKLELYKNLQHNYEKAKKRKGMDR